MNCLPSVAIVLSILPTLLAAGSYTCSEWSHASLQHRGQISVLLEDDKLIWSNGTNTYSAKLVVQTIGHATYFDEASVYMVFGIVDRGNVGLQKSPILVRRIFNVSTPMRVSELSCE